MNKKTVRDIDLKEKTVIMRVDYNVPLNDKHEVTDKTRIEASLETINYVLEQKAKLILMSHLGRPKGKVNPDMSLKPIVPVLSKLLGKDVKFVDECIGEDVSDAIAEMDFGSVLLLENVRFHHQEEKNDIDFARELASPADVYVNDAFGTAHRAHASTVGITTFLPSVIGFLIEKEIKNLSEIFSEPEKPFIGIIGGAKVSSKIGVLKALLNKVDKLIIGGGMTYTFYKAMGYYIGESICENDYVNEAKKLIEVMKEKGIELVLPIDNVVSDKVDDKSNTSIVDNQIPKGLIGVDIGPKTVDLIKEALEGAKTVFWNGPMGVFEISKFANGTKQVAQLISTLNAKTVVGGGDSVSAINQAGLARMITHVSTGGGASLEFIEGVELPGLKAISEK